MVALQQHRGLVTAFGPLPKPVYLEGDLPRTPLPLLILLGYRVNTAAEGGWRTLARLLHGDQDWQPLTASRLDLHEGTLQLCAEPLAILRPGTVALQPTKSQIERLIAGALR